MATYIQTPNGLYPIGGKVTKDKIINALGYTPSNFNGDYNSLKNKPEIIDDGSDSFYIADTQGNIIFKVDSNGIHSVDLTLDGKTISQIIQENTPSGDYNDLKNKPEILDDSSDKLQVVDVNGNIVLIIDESGINTVNVQIKGEEVALLKDINEVNERIDNLNINNGDSSNNNAYTDEQIELLKNEINESLTTHINNCNESLANKETVGTAQSLVDQLEDNITKTYATKNELNQKANSEHTHSFNDLKNKPNIVDDESNNLVVADSLGNIIFEISSNGVHSVNFFANGKDVALKHEVEEMLGNINSLLDVINGEVV